MTHNREKRLLVGIFLTVVLFLTLNVFASGFFTGAKLDLTEDKLFTLSDSTKRVLSELKEPVVLRLYLSKRLLQAQPNIANYAQQVQETLKQYEALSNGKLSVELYDPAPFSEIEDRAVAFGLRGLPLQGQDQAYFGLAATNSTDDQDIIPFFDPAREAFMEYDLTKMIYSLANPQKTVVGILTTLPMQGDFRRNQGPWVIADQMKQFFDVEFIDPDSDEIDDKISVLIVAHPKKMPEKTLYAVDRYVRSGGATLMFVDPHSEVAQADAARAGGRPSPDTASVVDPLFKAWGIGFDTEHIVGDAGSARRVQAMDGTRPVVTDYISWLALEQDQFAKDQVAFAQLERINMASAGYLTVPEGSGVTLQPLLSSTPNAMKVVADDVRMNPDPLSLIRRFKSEGTIFTLAARVGGTLGDPFPGDLPEGAKEVEKKDAPLNLVIFADADMLGDAFWVRVQDFFGEKIATPIAHNGDLILNLLDELSGGVQISDLRGRGLSVRRFEVVDELRAEAEVKFRAEEQALLDKITDVEKKLTELRSGGEDGADVTLTEEQELALDTLQGELLASRQQLRDVQHALLSDIDELKAWVSGLNIFAMPVLIAVFALILSISRRRRARRRAQA